MPVSHFGTAWDPSRRRSWVISACLSPGSAALQGFGALCAGLTPRSASTDHIQAAQRRFSPAGKSQDPPHVLQHGQGAALGCSSRAARLSTIH